MVGEGVGVGALSVEALLGEEAGRCGLGFGRVFGRRRVGVGWAFAL
jgi:hypothetical protein